VGKGQSRTIIDIKQLLHPIQDVEREIIVKEWRFVGRLDPKAVSNHSVRLRKNVEATTKQRPIGFDPREVLTIGNEHHQKHNPVRGQVMYLRVGIEGDLE
jgi:hypothetical protein